MPTEDKLGSKITRRLLGEHGLTEFILTVTDLSETNVDIEVSQVVSWEASGDVPVDLEPYFEATIKWDGCSHIWFGAIEGESRDGYLHLCGVTAWKSHVRVMEWAYREAAKLIVAMESDEIWEEA